jgi:hypothetical protein
VATRLGIGAGTMFRWVARRSFLRLRRGGDRCACSNSATYRALDGAREATMSGSFLEVVRQQTASLRLRPPKMRAGKLSFTARGKLNGCRPTADAGTFPRMTHHGHVQRSGLTSRSH